MTDLKWRQNSDKYNSVFLQLNNTKLNLVIVNIGMFYVLTLKLWCHNSFQLLCLISSSFIGFELDKMCSKEASVNSFQQFFTFSVFWTLPKEIFIFCRGQNIASQNWPLITERVKYSRNYAHLQCWNSFEWYAIACVRVRVWERERVREIDLLHYW